MCQGLYNFFRISASSCIGQISHQQHIRASKPNSQAVLVSYRHDKVNVTYDLWPHSLLSVLSEII